jgi:hypothetical protein
MKNFSKPKSNREKMISSLEKKLDKAIEEIDRIKEILRELKKDSGQDEQVTFQKKSS